MVEIEIVVGGRDCGPRGRRESWKTTDYRVKAEIPNFNGGLDIEGFLDRMYEVKKFYDIMEVLTNKMVKIVVYKLKGSAAAW